MINNNQNFLIVLLGAPGSGKGTLSEMMIHNLNYIHLSTGDIFRKVLKTSTPLAKKINDVISQGKLVSDDLTNELVQQELIKYQNQKIVLDGYPRTIDQANFLDNIINVNYVILIDINKDIAIKRISGRRLCSECNKNYNIYFSPSKKPGVCDLDNAPLIQRKDDNEESIIKRFKVFEQQTKPLINHYQKLNKLKSFDGNHGVNEIFEAIKKLK